MKKYKLIKAYPGSDPVGTIITGNKETMYSKGLGSRNYDWAHVENYPEYWEEVIEKDYEIVSYVAKDNPNNITTKRRGAHLHEEYWKIHSVKRLSDGEVFTIGDKVGVGNSTYPIAEFKVFNEENTILVSSYLKKGDSGVYNTRLKRLVKAKQPIFLTHDGKDIFDGDKVWYVIKRDFYNSYFITTSGTKFYSDIHAYFLTEETASDYINKNKVLFTTEDGVGIKKDEIVYVVDGRLNSIDIISNFVPKNYPTKNYPTMKAFSNSKAAEGYIIENKPVLSIKDLQDIKEKRNCFGVSMIIDAKDLVKQRLNLK